MNSFQAFQARILWGGLHALTLIVLPVRAYEVVGDEKALPVIHRASSFSTNQSWKYPHNRRLFWQIEIDVYRIGFHV